MFNFLNVSIWVILISGVANMAGGMLWYGPLFGKSWMKGMGIDPDDSEKVAQMQKGAGGAYAASLLFALIFGYTADLLINNLQISSLLLAICVTLLVYVGFTLSNTIKGRLWGEVSREVFFINTGFEIVHLLIVAIAAFYL